MSATVALAISRREPVAPGIATVTDDHRERARQEIEAEVQLRDHSIKTPAREAVERALEWGVSFTELDIQQFSGLEPRMARQYLSALVGGNVIVKVGDAYQAGPQAENWRLNPPKTRPGGNDPAARRRKAVLDRWRQEAWAKGRNGNRTPGPLYTVAEVDAALGMSPRGVRYWIADGRIRPAVSGPGVDMQISHQEITRFLEGQKP